MLTCYCGTVLVSKDKMWQCPNKGQEIAFDKGLHVGIKFPDKRAINMKEK